MSENELTCVKCGRSLVSQAQYDRHSKRKTDCSTDKIKKKKNSINEEENNHLKPIFKWCGGKKDEIKKYIQHIPTDIDTYLEPFVGGGATFFHLNHTNNVISDVHTELIDLYQSVKDDKLDDMHTFMTEHDNDEATYYEVRDRMEVPNSLENAKRFFYLRKTCFRGMLRYNSKGKFNIPFGRYKTYNFEELQNKKYTDILKNTIVLKSGFENIFENYNDPKNFMFLDPPYDSEFTDYGYCKFGKEDHKKLAECFKATSIRCLMVIGKTDFISELYDGYVTEEYEKKYRFKIHSGRVGDEINNKHLVIKNY
jgi:DNA adenine methylase